MNILALDLETTGLDPAKDRIIQIGTYSPLGGADSMLVNPGCVLPEFIRDLTGITQAEVDEAAMPAAALAWLCSRIGNGVTFEETASLGTPRRVTKAPSIIMHNGLNFDLPFLLHACENYGLVWPQTPVIDTAGLFCARQLSLLRAPYESWERYAARGLIARPLAMKYSLDLCCRTLGVRTDDVQVHQAGGDATMAWRVFEALTA